MALSSEYSYLIFVGREKKRSRATHLPILCPVLLLLVLKGLYRKLACYGPWMIASANTQSFGREHC